nr:hypothetical protein Iba_chr11bCG10090 [Ipomoea batatas]
MSCLDDITCLYTSCRPNNPEKTPRAGLDRILRRKDRVKPRFGSPGPSPELGLVEVGPGPNGPGSIDSRPVLRANSVAGPGMIYPSP